MTIVYQKCDTCHDKDVEFNSSYPATKDCFDCACKAFEESEKALMSTLTGVQKELFEKYRAASEARHLVQASMS